jgi:hypothetical protein
MVARRPRWRLSSIVPCALAVIACGTEPPRSPVIAVRLNELNPSNKVYPDSANETDDWIELCNLNSSDANLGGYFLSDSINTRFEQVLPAQTVVPANGVLLLWADGQLDQGPLHLNFKLSSGGDGVWLSNPEGYLVDSIEFGAVPLNSAGTQETSLARFPNGTGEFTWCTVSTPDEVNGATCTGQVLQ